MTLPLSTKTTVPSLAAHTFLGMMTRLVGQRDGWASMLSKRIVRSNWRSSRSDGVDHQGLDCINLIWCMHDAACLFHSIFSMLHHFLFILTVYRCKERKFLVVVSHHILSSLTII